MFITAYDVWLTLLAKQGIMILSVCSILNASETGVNERRLMPLIRMDNEENDN
jgi:hypothetical protein